MGKPPRGLKGAQSRELTLRERQVGDLLCEGMTNHEIADAMGIAVETVKTYLGQCYDKIGVGNRQELVASILHRRYSTPGFGTVTNEAVMELKQELRVLHGRAMQRFEKKALEVIQRSIEGERLKNAPQAPGAFGG